MWRGLPVQRATFFLFFIWLPFGAMSTTVLKLLNNAKLEKTPKAKVERLLKLQVSVCRVLSFCGLLFRIEKRETNKTNKPETKKQKKKKMACRLELAFRLTGRRSSHLLFVRLQEAMLQDRSTHAEFLADVLAFERDALAPVREWLVGFIEARNIVPSAFVLATALLSSLTATPCETFADQLISLNELDVLVRLCRDVNAKVVMAVVQCTSRCDTKKNQIRKINLVFWRLSSRDVAFVVSSSPIFVVVCASHYCRAGYFAPCWWFCCKSAIN